MYLLVLQARKKAVFLPFKFILDDYVSLKDHRDPNLPLSSRINTVTYCW